MPRINDSANASTTKAIECDYLPPQKEFGERLFNVKMTNVLSPKMENLLIIIANCFT